MANCQNPNCECKPGSKASYGLPTEGALDSPNDLGHEHFKATYDVRLGRYVLRHSSGIQTLTSAALTEALRAQTIDFRRHIEQLRSEG